MIKILETSIQVPGKVVSDNLEKKKSNIFFNEYFKPEKIEVAQRAFYDLSFDPDFSETGDHFHKTGFFHFLIKMVCNTIKYFFQNPREKASQEEERAFQELIQIEKIWQNAAQAKGMLYPEDTDTINKTFWQCKAPHICDLKEYQFFKQLSKIASMNESVKQVYSRELLKPVHAFNRPQIPDQCKKNILNQEDTGKEIRNGDVARLSTWGFILLDNHTTKNYRITHKVFLESIDTAGNALKLSIRKLRLALREGNYETFNERLKDFKVDWNKYIESHQLLKELSTVYSQEDFFEKKYQIMENLYQKMQYSDVYHKEDVLTIINDEFREISDQEEKCSKKLYESFCSKFPDSGTTKEFLEKRASLL
ncbi:hypothetical protein [Candidatus Rhabdochlamydia sp. T3358]|uniref:hypothetical protein n=1 Tax=Candidatus Rhabdochlamydia sp. T3358 TaxID=2099795 RepID=UPI0010B0FC11|nr:hypothetical protein [Candidatus Rhabdochlamydia sp. T3358]VHO03986.1 hypothetical protein RHT_01150 [Candidatus Rhabdochlamydia sp. T3358]